MKCSKCLLVVCCLVLSYCHPARINKTAEHLSDQKAVLLCNLECILKKIANDQNIHYFSAKGNIQYTYDNINQDARISILAIQDSLCLISLKKIGIEAFRILLLPDRLIVLDRLNQNYQILNYSELENKHQLTMQFDWIQNLLTTACFINKNSDYNLIDSTEMYKINGRSTHSNLYFELSKTDLLCKQFNITNTQHDIKIVINEHVKLENRIFPAQIKIELQTVQKSVLSLELNWDQIKLDKIKLINFKIPEHYTKK